MTLAQVVARLKPIHGLQPAVDKALIAKPVTVAGLGNASSTDVLRALAAVYGLQIGATDKDAARNWSAPRH